MLDFSMHFNDVFFLVFMEFLSSSMNNTQNVFQKSCDTEPLSAINDATLRTAFFVKRTR